MGTKFGLGGWSGCCATTHLARNLVITATVPGTSPTLLVNTASGQTTYKSSTNSTSALSLQSSSGSTILNLDTTNQRIGINTTTPGAPLQVAPSNVISTYSEGFESGTLGTMTSASTGIQWTAQTVAKHDGTYGARALGNASASNKIADMTLTKTIPAGGAVLSYWVVQNGCWGIPTCMLMAH